MVRFRILWKWQVGGRIIAASSPWNDDDNDDDLWSSFSSWRLMFRINDDIDVYDGEKEDESKKWTWWAVIWKATQSKMPPARSFVDSKPLMLLYSNVNSDGKTTTRSSAQKNFQAWRCLLILSVTYERRHGSGFSLLSSCVASLARTYKLWYQWGTVLYKMTGDWFFRFWKSSF